MQYMLYNAFNFSKIKYYIIIFLEKVQNIFLIFNNNYPSDFLCLWSIGIDIGYAL